MHKGFFALGVRYALMLPAWIVGFSLFGVGSLAREVGLPAGSAVLATLFIWAGPAQLIVYGGLATGSALPAIAAAVCLSSMRLLPMTMSVLPWLRRGDRNVGTQLFAAHLVTVTTWVESNRRLPELPPEGRIPYFFGFSGTCLLVSTVLTGLGYGLVGAMPVVLAAAMLCLTPIFFTVSVVAGARNPADWLAVASGFALAPLFTWLIGKDFDLLATGLLGGTAAYGLSRVLGRQV